MEPEVPSRARRALPALCRSEKEGVRRTPEPSRINKYMKCYITKLAYDIGLPPNVKLRVLKIKF